MKHLLLAISFLLLPFINYSQERMLGQTKQYCIKQNADCYIEQNTDTLVAFSCDAYKTIYSFSKSTKLCEAIGVYFSLCNLSLFIGEMKKRGFSEYQFFGTPLDKPNMIKAYCHGNVVCLIAFSGNDEFLVLFRDAPYCQ